MIRPPAFSRGFTSLAWAVGFGLFIWIFLLGVGVGFAPAFLFGLISAGLIFFLVRLFGGDEFQRR